MKSLKFKLNIPKVEYFQKEQQNPCVYVYFVSDSIKKQQKPTVYPLTWSHFNKQFTFDQVLPTEKLDDSLLLAFDFYVETKNDKNVYCRMHRGLANVFIKDAIKRVTKHDKKVSTDLLNAWANTVFGNIEVDFTDFLSEDKIIKFKNQKTLFFEDAAVNKKITDTMISLIKGEMGMFGGENGHYVLRATNKFLTRVHAPLFHSRTFPMPGFAYVLNSEQLPCTDDWFNRYYSHAKQRLGLTESFVIDTIKKQFQSKIIIEGFHQCCLLLTTMVSLTASCYPYETDFFVRNGQNKPFESFDNEFLRRAGDCEDFARGMHFVLSTFQTKKIKKLFQGMLQLQKVANLYLSGIVLAEVTTPQHGGVLNIFKNRQAHMYTQIFPVKYFIENIDTKNVPGKKSGKTFETIKNELHHRDWMDYLRVYVIEGTAPVQPFSSISSMATEMDSEKRDFEIKSNNTLNPACPVGLAREYRPAWSVQRDSFYKNCAHFYTDFFVRKGAHVGSFSFVDKNTDKYGVDLQQVLEKYNFKFVPHQFFDQSDMELMTSILRYEAPFPVLDYPGEGKGLKQLLSGKNKNVIQDFKKQMETRIVGEPYNEKLYNDFFIQSPHSLSIKQFNSIFKFFKQHTNHQEIFEEGFDTESYIIRIRAWGIQ